LIEEITMATAARESTTTATGFVFDGVSWDDYEAMLRIVGDGPPRVTYDEGRMEIMSPLRGHGGPSYLLGIMVSTLVEELDILYEPADPVTFRRKDLLKGVEPDKCFWFGHNAERVRHKRDVVLPADLQPDLVVEIDLTASSLERLPIFAALGIPEVWRVSEDAGLEFLHLTPDGVYLARESSLAFPALRVAEASRFFKEGLAGDKTKWGREFRRYVRESLA
jgi:Uma2 family endonuclease